jgi:hypothetical protein
VTRRTQNRTKTRTPVANGSNVVPGLRRNCHTKHVIGEKIEGTRRRRRIRKQPLGDNKREDTVTRKKKHFDHTLWGARFARGYGPATREIVFGTETAVIPCKDMGHWDHSTHKDVVYIAEGDLFFFFNKVD